jgi:ABC-type uncharacterized transport system auxiliary subunit
MSRWTWLWLAWLPLATACVSSFKVPAPDIRDYRLEYPSPAIARPPLPVVLQIARFRSAAIYAREAIVYRESDYATGTYPYHRWVANPASMIADFLARDFSASGVYRAVQQGASLLIADYELGADIDEIEERVVRGGCSAHLSLRVLLFRTRVSNDPIMLREAYSADEPCGATGPEALVGAMSRALQRISERVQVDVYDAIAGDQARFFGGTRSVVSRPVYEKR